MKFDDFYNFSGINILVCIVSTFYDQVLQIKEYLEFYCMLFSALFEYRGIRKNILITPSLQ